MHFLIYEIMFFMSSASFNVLFVFNNNCINFYMLLELLLNLLRNVEFSLLTGKSQDF